MKKFIFSILTTATIFGTFSNFALADDELPPVIITDENPERDPDILVED